MDKNVIADKQQRMELPKEVIKEILEKEELTKKERRQLKFELFMRQFRMKPPVTH